MEIEIQITREPIAEKISVSNFPHGAWLEFRGVVRGEENGETISALEYEIYSPMAENEIRRILEMLGNKFPCLAAKIIHRVGKIPVGETAIYVGLAAKHRGEAISLLAEFMDRLKQTVPIWKTRAIKLESKIQNPESRISKSAIRNPQSAISSDEAILEINSHCRILPAIRVSLEESFGRILREDIFAPEDFPPCDKSTRDGFAILQNDGSEVFQIVDTIHAADWKPRELKIGEAIRIATGASLPCKNLRVVMQENVARDGDKIKIANRESDLNVRQRGEEMRAGELILRSGTKLDAGKLALLATVGRAQPLVNPKLRVVHFTTGDEIVSPGKIPQPGQIRDSNSILIRALLKFFDCDLTQQHLPEDFELAKSEIENRKSKIENADVILISGGASVGEKDFTRDLLEHLDFETIFNRVAIRPGAPLIFGVAKNRVAFGLPGNPLSHFVCFQLFVANALAKMLGTEPHKFSRGKLAENVADQNTRETFWPARFEFSQLQPLKWASSGDVKCLAETNALIRVQPNRVLAAGDEIEFLPTI